MLLKEGYITKEGARGCTEHEQEAHPCPGHGRWHLILQPGMAGTRNSPKLQGFLQSNAVFIPGWLMELKSLWLELVAGVVPMHD